MNFIRSRDIWGLFWLLAFSCPRRSIVDTVSLCDDWRYLEVIEKSDDNTFTCTGLREQQDVVWFWDTFRVATCPPPTSTCTVLVPTANTFFRFSRTSTTASNITALATAATNLDFFGTARVTCEISAQESVTCPLDSVYPAENITCKVQFNEDTWDVTSWCVVSKVRSTRNKYGCYVYQTQGSQESIRVGSYNMSTVGSTLSNYSSGTCNMTSYLPSDGRYSYTVLIMPGEVNVPAVFYGSNEIRRPKSIPVHNCPLYVKEDNSVSCVCSVDDLGSPPGQLKWNNMNSEQLVLPGVKMDQNGVNYVCSLTWNTTVVQSVTYTLLVAYPPTQNSFKLNNASENVVVTEKSPVTMLCQSDGRPTPNMTITDVTNGNRVLHSQPGGNVTLADHRVQTRYDKVVECEDTGEYKCTADNIIGSKYQVVKLFVMCTPRTVNASSTPPTIVEGKSTSFELIAYPNSVKVAKYFMGSNNCSSETPASDDIFHVVCSPNSQLLYKVTCTVTVIKVTVNTAGLYKAVVSNDLGSVALIFEALQQQTTGSENHDDVTSSEFSRGLGIGLGIAAAEAVVVATVHLVFFWRRKQRTMKAKGGRGNTGYSSTEDISLDKATELTLSSGREHESPYEAIGNEAGQTPANTNVQGSHLSSRKTSNKTGNLYDGLDLQNVGVSSPYVSLT